MIRRDQWQYRVRRRSSRHGYEHVPMPRPAMRICLPALSCTAGCCDERQRIHVSLAPSISGSKCEAPVEARRPRVAVGQKHALRRPGRQVPSQYEQDRGQAAGGAHEDAHHDGRQDEARQVDPPHTCGHARCFSCPESLNPKAKNPQFLPGPGWAQEWSRARLGPWELSQRVTEKCTIVLAHNNRCKEPQVYGCRTCSQLDTMTRSSIVDWCRYQKRLE